MKRAKRRIIPVFVPHAGCPHDCIFCNQRKIAGQTIYSPEQAERDIREALTKTDKAELAFYGGSFTAIEAELQERYLELAAGLYRDGRITGVRLSTRPDCIDGRVLERLKRYPVKTVELGIQSMDDRVLELSGRGHTARQSLEAMKAVREAGFEAVGQMMCGLPGDTEEGAEMTAREIAGAGAAAVRIYPVAVIKGTRLCELYEMGEYRPLETEEAARLCGRLLLYFHKAGVEVIRCGLNPTDTLGDEIAAGVYHPAFGELALGEAYLSLIRKALLPYGEALRGARVEVRTGPSFLSPAVGQKRRNLIALRDEQGASVRVVPDTKLGKFEIAVELLREK